METPEKKTVQKFEESTLDIVIRKVNTFQELGELRIPPDYAPQNALRSAWLILQETKDKNDKPVLESCTKVSIANALLKMVVEGLTPMKHQGYFVARGNKLEWNREYHGTIALAKRYSDMKEVNAQIIYEGDTFKYKIDTITGRKSIVEHDQKFENLDITKIKGAYAIIQFHDGTTDLEIMTIAQIHNAWNQGAMKGQSPAHKNFTDQMAKKTVINRACKLLISTSNDEELMEDTPDDKFVKRVKEDIKDGSLSEEIDMNEVEVQTPEVVEEKKPEAEQPKPEPQKEHTDPGEQTEQPRRGRPLQAQQTKAPF